MKIIVTGGEGTMGRALREFLPDAKYLSHKECDVTTLKSVQNAIYLYGPEVVIHAAAITNHQHPNASEIIETNIIGTEFVARCCRAIRAKMVYLSTHYVYPGETGNYRETDATRPIGTYAWSKLAGEAWAQTVPDWLVVRGSWYTPEKLDSWERNGAFTDCWCNRVRPSVAAPIIADLIRREATGVYNIGGERQNFYQIAVGEGRFPRPFTNWRYERDAPPYSFPKDSSVNTDKYRSLVGE